ncbi:MAG: hypothetical protein ACK4LB_14945 [Spirosomataceae bacterium]
MKQIISLTWLFLLSHLAMGQWKLSGQWIKSEITLTDGSPVYKPELVESWIQYDFLPGDTLLSTINGKSRIFSFRLEDSVLVVDDLYFKVKEYQDIRLVLAQIPSSPSDVPVQLIFTPRHLASVGFVPRSYVAQNGDIVYESDDRYLVPSFLDGQRTISSFVYEKMEFPEWRKGLFLARAVITKTGEVVGVRVEESSNPKFNAALIDAIRASRGKWRPALWEGKPVNTEIIIRLDLNWSRESNQPDPREKLAEAEAWYDEGLFYLNIQQYKQAITAFSEAIKLDYKHINAYYGRINVYIALKNTEKVCEDLKQLTFLGQKKAKEIYERQCPQP